jgi:hypothetical protein
MRTARLRCKFATGARPVLAAATMSLVACGGGDAGPVPLSHHFDDMHIAAVPLEQKAQVIKTQNEYSVAKMKRAKAEADHAESETKLEIATNERQQALLAERSAHSEKKAADKSADMTRINAAAAELRAAQTKRRAADEKVSWLKAHRKYLKKFLRYSEESVYAQEAQYELAKARLAHSRNIRPQGFDVAVFQRQYQDRSQRSERAKTVADQALQKSEARRKQWQSLSGADKKPNANPTTTDSSAPDENF